MAWPSDQNSQYAPACDAALDQAEALDARRHRRPAGWQLDGANDDRRLQRQRRSARRDLPIVATVAVAGDEMTVDLTGTAPQMARCTATSRSTRG
jgi:hypothetical protein